MLTVAIVASLVRLIYGAPTRAAAEAAIDVFAGKYDPKYEKAVACLTKDREALLASSTFPPNTGTIRRIDRRRGATVILAHNLS